MALGIRDLVLVHRPALLSAFLVSLVLLSLPASAHADGRIFVREKVPPTIPYQRALIVFDRGRETLVLQSKYSLPASGAGNGEATAPTSATTTFGWVVPVPAVPEFDSMAADDASDLFFALSRDSMPDALGWIAYSGFLAMALMLLSLSTLVVCLFPSFFRAPGWVHRHRRSVYDYALLVFIAGFFWGFLVCPNFLSGNPAGVDVIKEQRVGIYDVKVVQSDDSARLVDWLNDNSFVFGDADRVAFDRYIHDGWCFVVARINPSVVGENAAVLTGKNESEREIVAEGLVAPLVLRFPHDVPIYPLALTATGGHKTEVLIYLITRSKMTCGSRLPLRYAQFWSWPTYRRSGLQLLRTPPASSNLYLTKFRGTLTPEQMSEDLVFTRASDNEPFRETVFRW